MNTSQMTKEEKLNLYNQAKTAYYTGEEIMSDLEFDELERELGLENVSEVGDRSRNPSYTIKHPVIMGSLSKVQVHKDDNGNIDWESVWNDVQKYVYKNGNVYLLATPKYDGCSFEVVIKNGKIENASTRGDGRYGKDITELIKIKIREDYTQQFDSDVVLRGEVLIDKKVFMEKYGEEFANPRSFVSGMVNRDFENTKEYREKANDLSLVIYTYKQDNGEIDCDFLDIPEGTYSDLSYCPRLYKLVDKFCTWEQFKALYERFDEYRKECPYALDGIVLMPVAGSREKQTTPRPKDCVAIKFVPMVQVTTINKIVWNLGKTGEMVPIVYVDPIELDGKMIGKCSGFNYGYLMENRLSPGCKVILSLAGDIIPYLYKIVDNNQFDEKTLDIPEGTHVDGCHLMKVMTEKEYKKNKFIYSCGALEIPGIGRATAESIFESFIKEDDKITDAFFEDSDIKKEIPANILECTPEDVYEGAGGGKAGKNAMEAFKKIIGVKNLRLKDVIKSCTFESCGERVASEIEKFLLTGDADFEHLPGKAYDWIYNKNSVEMKELERILGKLGMVIEDFEKHESESVTSDDRIPAILTGNPNGYESKAQFLEMNPMYRNTTKWKECKIVFTNSMDSNTSKMKKARELGIEIRVF